MTKTIPLTQGQYAIVDDEDYDRVSQFLWVAHKSKTSWYASRHDLSPNRRRVSMHRFILGASQSVLVDHVDGNGLNNTRANLRLCTHQQNAFNSNKKSTNKSGYKGVHWRKRERKWVSVICVNGKSIHLGSFNSPKDAALAYDTAARKYHGEFARVNFGIDDASFRDQKPEGRKIRTSVRNKSGYIGVSKSGEHWLASIKVKGKSINLGLYDSAETAALVWDIAARKYRGEATKTNFEAGGEKFDREDTRYQRVYKRKYCAYVGVCAVNRRWVAQISIKGERIHLGYYDTPEQAARAWDAAAIHYRGKGTRTNFPQDEEE